jgi:ketosteroid isomerase-like protein
MSRHREFFQEITETINANRPYPISAWFTEDFRLHDPQLPNWPVGHEGAQAMMDLFQALSEPIRLEVMDMIEDGDRVAVRWRLSATRDGEPLHSAIIAMYRFEGERIAEDWGVSFRGEWP